MAAIRYWRIIIWTLLLISSIHIGTATASEILVGATVSLEGSYEAPSRMIRLAYQLWEKQINESGGLLGRRVRLVLYDDKSQKEWVEKYYEKLIVEDKVDLVLAPYGTGLSYVASEVTERHGFVLLASGASGEMIWNRGFRFVFGVYGTAKRYFIGFLDLVARNGLKTVAILNEDTLFTKDAAQGARIWTNRLGLQVQLQHTFKNGKAEFPELLARLKALAPDAVLLCAYPPEGYLFLNQLADSDFRPKALAMSIAPSLPDFYEKAGAMAENVFGPSQWEPDERIPFPGTQRFIDAFKADTGVNPSYHAGSAYAGCQLLQESVIATGKMDHQKMRDYIASLDTVTVIGRFKVDSQGRQIGHNTIMIQWQDGKKEIVYPIKMQTALPRISSSNPIGK